MLIDWWLIFQIIVVNITHKRINNASGKGIRKETHDENNHHSSPTEINES